GRFLGRSSGIGVGFFRCGGDVGGGFLGRGSGVGSSLLGGCGVDRRVFLGAFGGVTAGGEGEHAGGGNGDELGVQSVISGIWVGMSSGPGLPTGRNAIVQNGMLKKEKPPDWPAASLAAL